MKLRQQDKPRVREPDLIGLINIIFLILVFFIVAGTLRPFSAADIELAKTEPDVSGIPAPTRLVAHQDGAITYAGTGTTDDSLSEQLAGLDTEMKAQPFVIVADGRLQAARLIEIARIVRAAGFAEISVLTEKRATP